MKSVGFPNFSFMLTLSLVKYFSFHSIAVSAKNKDGSVEATLQALVRHLLLKLDLRQFKAVKVKATKKVKKKKHVKVAKEELLTPVGDEEVGMDRCISSHICCGPIF